MNNFIFTCVLLFWLLQNERFGQRVLSQESPVQHTEKQCPSIPSSRVNVDADSTKIASTYKLREGMNQRAVRIPRRENVNLVEM